MPRNKIKNINFENILRSLPTSLIIINRDKEIVEMTPEVKGLLGEDIGDKGIFSIFSSKDKNIFDEVFNGGEIEREVIDLEDRIIGFSACPIYGEEENIMGASIILRDITDIKEMEEELRRKDRLAALGEMVAGMAHEIRNPLASIKAGIEALSIKDSEESKYKKIILSEIERLERIVRDMMLYAGQQNLNRERVNLKNLIKQSIVMLNQNIRERNIAIEESYNGELECMVDRDHMITVLNNLMFNAIESIGTDGKVKISVRGKEEEMEIEISDTGGGIEDEDLSKIFIPFFTTKNKGTGLGLSITNRIIQKHNGRIKAENNNGGASFYIHIPRDN